MKRSNRFVIGTVLFLLVAALIFIQSRNTGIEEDGHEHEATPTAARPDKAPPTVEDLQREIGGAGSAGGPVLRKKPGTDP
ncbi:MAG: hypothetical protein H0W86_01860 [Armatimonadetes bacterium]|nr:hypothetical protein [Armatimonadota bacterium]